MKGLTLSCRRFPRHRSSSEFGTMISNIFTLSYTNLSITIRNILVHLGFPVSPILQIIVRDSQLQWSIIRTSVSRRCSLSSFLFFHYHLDSISPPLSYRYITNTR